MSKSVDFNLNKKKPGQKEDFIPFKNENLFKNEQFTEKGSIRKNVIFKTNQKNEEDKEELRKKTSNIFLQNSRNIFAANLDINKGNFLS